MINSVSSAASASAAVLAHTVPQPKPPQTSQAAPQDSVELSSKATAKAAGDVDHDGDSS
jgi:hypothetical protein